MRLLASMSSSILVGGLALSLANACSDSGGGGGGSSGGCQGLAAALCGKLDSCFPALIEWQYGDKATCTKRAEISCQEDIAAPGSLVTNDKLSSCASAISALSCDGLLNGEGPQACELAGDRADGQPCGSGVQCQSSYCNVPDGATCGTCAPRSAAGGPCTENEGCQSGLVCASNVCATPVAAGGACTSTGQCDGNLVCRSGTCAQPAGAGEACNPQAGDCDFAAGLFCDSQTSICKSITFADAGAACGLLQTGIVLCRAGGTCKTAPGATQGTCAATAADGAACDETQGPNCALPAECVNGTCQLPNPDACG